MWRRRRCEQREAEAPEQRAQGARGVGVNISDEHLDTRDQNHPDDAKGTMKTILILLVAGTIIAIQTGCAARATVGHHDQHGVGVSARAHGADRGVSAREY